MAAVARLFACLGPRDVDSVQLEWASRLGCVVSRSVARAGPPAIGKYTSQPSQLPSRLYVHPWTPNPPWEARYLVSPETDGTTWTEFDGVAIPRGFPINMVFDRQNHVLYSANGVPGGLWALRTR
jgi:hypothetical protein